MTDITPSHDLFRPKLSRSETKAEITDRSARSIIEAEAKLRERKTEKLRQARLESKERKDLASLPTQKRAAKVIEPKGTVTPSTKYCSGDEVIT